jgi:hypothetical protein
LTNFINYLLFFQKFSSLKFSPFSFAFFPSLLFFSLFSSLSSFLLSSHVQHAGAAHEKVTHLVLHSKPPNGAPTPSRPSPSPSLPSPASSPMVLPMELQLRPWLLPMESTNQSCFSLWDNQNRCTRPPSCYPRPQFYLKPILISGFYGISFFN